MTRFAFVADVHLGNHARWGGPVVCGLNDRCRETLEVLGTVAHQLRFWGPQMLPHYDRLVSLGDLFDTDHPLPQLVAAVQSITALKPEPGITTKTPANHRWLLLAGNHDKTSGAKGDHALSPLGLQHYIIDEPHGSPPLALIPHQKGRAAEWLPEAVSQLRRARDGGVAALCVHVGVITEETPPWLRDSPDAVPIELLAQQARRLGANAVFAGNWHNRLLRYVAPDGAVLMPDALNESKTTAGGPVAKWREDDLVSVFQLGALVPTGFDNPGLHGYGTVAVFDTEAAFGSSIQWMELPGPRFVTVKSRAEAEVVVAEAGKLGHRLYLVWEAKSADLPYAKEFVAKAVGLKTVHRGEAVPDRAEAGAAATTAARGLRRTSNVDELAVDFTSKAAFPVLSGESAKQQRFLRGEILEQCRRFLVGTAAAGAKTITVQSIEADGIFNLSGRDVTLPKKGLVLVTGPNGSGKSATYTDAVAVALWGKTARKTPPWREGEDSVVRVNVVAGDHDLDVKRWRSSGGGSPGLSYSPDGTKFETPTKTQEKLNQLIGSFDQWRSTSVFDAAEDTNLRFGKLTDSGRKDFLEAVIGIDFEPALKQCKVELTSANTKLTKIEQNLHSQQVLIKDRVAVVRTYERSVGKAATRSTKKAGDVAGAKKDLDDAQARARTTREELGKVATSRGRVQANLATHTGNVKVAKLDSCPTCGQGLPEAPRLELLRNSLAVIDKLRSEAIALEEKERDLRGALGKWEEDIDQFRNDYANAMAVHNELARQESALDEAEKALDEAEAKLEVLRNQQIETKRLVGVLAACEQTLGLRGIRAQLSSQILGVIEQNANAWLIRLQFGGTVALNLGDDGKILLTIEGVGGGYGYPALSLGERGRVDLAFVRAFASLHGDDGTLIFDEPFGNIDSEGLNAAVQLIEELATTRCVVLIAQGHSSLLAALKPKAVKFEELKHAA